MIFISYRKTDSQDIVNRLEHDLSEHFGADNVFLDQERLQPGSVWPSELEEKASNCKVMLAVIGENWQTAVETSPQWKGIPRLYNPEDWVRKEIGLALRHERLVVPLLLNSTELPDKEWLEPCELHPLHSLQQSRLRSNDYEHDLQRLIKFLESNAAEANSDSINFSGPPLSTDIPHNLPRLQPFFGREEELKKIADALDPEARTWGALIDGPGGMGKTSLAVRAAYDASPEVFEKIVFLSLKTRELDDDGERDLSGFILSGLVELWNELARELGQDDIVKSAEEERPRLLLEALRGTQTLLLLDNLESLTKSERDTLFTFVKKLPAGCKAILTSRGRIGSGAEEIILEKFTEDAALKTLAELATHNPLLAQTSEAERITLYKQTGGSPLLLRWTAGQIGRGHCRTFTDARHFLRSCPEGNDPLEFVFGDLVDDFSDAETRVLSALTYFREPAEVKHIHAIVDESKDWNDSGTDESDGDYSSVDETQGITVAEAESALRSLSNRSLAVPTDELKAFSLVPMVAAFLRKKKPDIVKGTGDRLENRAFALINENGFQKHECFPALESAWPSITPALSRFLGGDNNRLQTVYDAVTDFLNFSGRWDERIALSEKAEMKASASADYYQAGWCAYFSGMTYARRAQAEEVLACVARATDHWEAAKAGARERAAALCLEGQGHRLKNDYPAAVAVLREALTTFRSLDAESMDVATALHYLGLAEMDSGELDAAERDLCEALSMARAVDDEGVAAITTSNLAALAIKREEWTEAEDRAREALQLSEALHLQVENAHNNRYISLALAMQRRAADALPYARSAVEIYTRLGHPHLTFAENILKKCEADLSGEDATT
ncbi:MAG: TIR domain-containing protein [Verrucomicrobiota bacterium]